MKEITFVFKDVSTEMADDIVNFNRMSISVYGLTIDDKITCITPE